MEKEAEVVALSQEIAEKEKAVNESKIRGAARAKNELLNKAGDLEAKLNRNKGAILKTRESIRELEGELRQKPYVNAEDDFRKALVNKVVHEKAQKDIRVYRTALDHAVMTFHHKKMEAINKHLKLYWQKIYKGNDIDYIMIKTDNEDPDQANAAVVNVDMNKTQRKIYNYR
jgi:DNA repair protein RAD50